MQGITAALCGVIIGAALSAGSMFGAEAALQNVQPLAAETLAVMGDMLQPEQFSMKAAGDIMVARKVGKYITAQGTSYPIEFIGDYMADADFTMANLESPLSTQGEPIEGKGIWFRADPKNVAALTDAGFDLVTLANNHAVDYDSPALLETIDVLNAAGIKHVGGGANIDEARQAEIFEINGVKVGCIGYSEMADIFWSYATRRTLKATENVAGIAPLYENYVLEDIAKLQEQGAEVIIVTLHWGIEYNEMPESYQQELAHAFIDAGADLIIGHHPHCIQGVETYKDGLILYSLGNFIFDQDWSLQTRQGLVLEAEITPLGWKNAKLVPILMTEGQPQLATGDDNKAITDLVTRISQPFGTNLQVEDGKIIILGGE